MPTELLTDPKHIRSDLTQIAKAVKQDWKIPDELMVALPKAIAAIVFKGKDRDRVAAAKVILAMKEQNDKPEPQQNQPTVVNVGVNVDNRTDDSRAATLAIAKRIREARLPGRVQH